MKNDKLTLQEAERTGRCIQCAKPKDNLEETFDNFRDSCLCNACIQEREEAEEYASQKRFDDREADITRRYMIAIENGEA